MSTVHRGLPVSRRARVMAVAGQIANSAEGRRLARAAGRKAYEFLSSGGKRKRAYETSGPQKKSKCAAGSIVNAKAGKRTSAEAASSDRHAIKQRISKKKKIGAKQNKDVKVSRELRAKVNKIIDGKYYNGVYHKIGANSMGFIRNGQTITNLTLNNGGKLFTYDQFLDAASVLWNKKTPGEATTFGDTNNIQSTNSHIHVMNSFCQIKMRNNTQRTITTVMYECSPKNEETVQTSPVGTWEAALVQDASNGINVRSITSAFLGLRPQANSNWTKNWNYNATEVVLEPGMATSFSISGPRNFVCKMEDSITGGTRKSINKIAKYVFFVTHGDILPGISAGALFSGDRPALSAASIATGEGLVWEHREVYKIAIPETIGASVTTVAGAITTIGGISTAGTGTINFPLNNKFRAYAYFNSTGAATSLGRYDEENPVTVDTNL